MQTHSRRWNRRHSTIRTTALVALGLTALCAGIVGLGYLADRIPAWAMAAGILGVCTLGLCVLARKEGS